MKTVREIMISQILGWLRATSEENVERIYFFIFH